MENKFSLPSISKLLGIADAGSPASTASSASSLASACTERGTDDVHKRHMLKASWAEATAHGPTASSASRQGRKLLTNNPSYSSAGRIEQHFHEPSALPPTPPLGSDRFDSHRDPVANSLGEACHAPFAGDDARILLQVTPPPTQSSIRCASLPQQAMPRAQPVHLSLLCSQRQLPSACFPTSPDEGSPLGLPVHDDRTTYSPLRVASLDCPPSQPQTFFRINGGGVVDEPWQHHHYLNPIHGAAYPQSQDRYVCVTCNKTFSRPSSLRTHSHSHTGEKPFKCPRAGCGKAFSVRSNMKRHERGCHTFSIHAGRPPTQRGRGSVVDFNRDTA